MTETRRPRPAAAPVGVALLLLATACASPVPVEPVALPAVTTTTTPPTTTPRTTTSTPPSSTYSPTPTPTSSSPSTAPTTSRSTTTSRTTDPTTTTQATITQSTTTTRDSGRTGPGPLGTTAVGTWWSPGADQFSASNLWVFDPVGEAIPYGFRKGYQPTGTITPYEQQFSFVYEQSGNSLVLDFPSGTVQDLTLLEYDSAADILTVDWEGYVERWAGCDSGYMPAVALAACR